MKKKGIVLASIIVVLIIFAVGVCYFVNAKKQKTALPSVNLENELTQAEPYNEEEEASFELQQEAAQMESLAELQQEKKRFAKYFDETIPNYEFLIKNPMLFGASYYFPNLDAVKGKIVVKISEDYDLWEDGSKNYGDSDGWYYGRRYYEFDDEGRIKAEFFISQDIYQEKARFTRNPNYDTYEYDSNRYKQKEIFLESGKETITEYSIIEEGDKLIFERTDSYNNVYQKIIEKGKVTTLKLNDNKLIDKSEYIYSDSKVISRDFLINDEGTEELFREDIYDKGVLVKVVIPYNDGQKIHTYVLDDGTKGRIEYESSRTNNNWTSASYLERRFNDAGFLEYSMEGPLNIGEPGFYTITNTLILDEPDEFFLEYFGEYWDKGGQ